MDLVAQFGNRRERLRLGKNLVDFGCIKEPLLAAQTDGTVLQAWNMLDLAAEPDSKDKDCHSKGFS